MTRVHPAERGRLRRLAAGVGDQPVQRARVGGHVDRVVEADVVRPCGVMITFARPIT